MLTDLYIDPASGDLDIDALGRVRRARGFEIIAQRLRIRLLRWRGEFILDLRLGVPYAEKLFAGKGLTSAQARGVFLPVIAGTSGVRRVLDLDVTRESETLSVTFRVDCDPGVITGKLDPVRADILLAFDDAAGRAL